MKSNEVRQGNYAYYKYWNPNPSNPSWEFEVVEIVGVLKETFYFKLKNDKRTHKIGELHPITLNEEWLLKMGFNNFNGEWYDIKVWINHLNVNLKLKCFTISNPDVDEVQFECENIEFVHQLQNLYWALTGEELTINEK